MVSSKIRLYADDILLYSTIKSEQDCLLLQEDINKLLTWSTNWQLLFNHEKCEFLRMTNKVSPIAATYFMGDNIIKETTSVKYLGITINSKLNWSDHIANITSKASSVLGFLQRNFKKCPINTKVSLYKSMVLPILEYGCAIWDPFTAKDIDNIEKIQRRAARFILNDYSWNTSVTQLLQKLNLPSLKSRRTCQKAIMIYKIIHSLVCIPSSHLIPNTSKTRHHQYCFRLPYSRLNAHLYSFFPSAIRIWNNLSSSIINSSSLDTFKKNLFDCILN